MKNFSIRSATRWRMHVITSIVIGTSLVGNSLCYAAPAQIHTIALTGQEAPGTGGAVYDTLQSIGPPINANGTVHFRATLTGAQIASGNNSGLWVGDGNTLNKVAQTGDTAPGTNNSFEEIVFSGPINASDEVVFRARLTDSEDLDGDGDADAGIWTTSGGSLALLAREGDNAPGFGSNSFTNLTGGAPVISDTGQVVFFALVSQGSSSVPSIWTGTPGVVSVLAVNGQQASGQDAGVNYNALDQPLINRVGETAFGSFVSGPGFDSENSDSYFTQDGSALGRNVRAGEQAPGTSPGTTFTGFADIPGWNDAGQIGVAGSTSDGGFGVWAGTPNALSLIAKSGMSAPGIPGGVTFKEFARAPISADGAVSFLGVLQGPTITEGVNDRVLWTNTNGSLEMILRMGDHAPGTPDGVVFANAVTPQVADDFIVIDAVLSGPGINGTNDKGLWVYRNGQLELLFRDGDTIEVSPGIYKTVEQLGSLLSGSPGIETGYGSSTNEAGQVAFQATFSDDTQGIFVLNIPVPEPATAVVMLPLAALFFTANGRNRRFQAT